MPRLRKRAAGLLIGAILLFFLATNVQSGWLYVFSALLLGALLAGWVMPVRGVRGLDVTRGASEQVHQGEASMVDVVVANRATRDATRHPRPRPTPGGDRHLDRLDPRRRTGDGDDAPNRGPSGHARGHRRRPQVERTVRRRGTSSQGAGSHRRRFRIAVDAGAADPRAAGSPPVHRTGLHDRPCDPLGASTRARSRVSGHQGVPIGRQHAPRALAIDGTDRVGDGS